MKQEIGFEKGRRHVLAQSTIPFEQRPTCTLAEACNAAGLGKTKFYELLAQGMIETLWILHRKPSSGYVLVDVLSGAIHAQAWDAALGTSGSSS